MTETDPIVFRPAGNHAIQQGSIHQSIISFDRRELNQLLSVYGRRVAEGEWRDYAIDMLRDRAVFSVFRRTAEAPLYRIEKMPKLARRQGAYSVVNMTGMIMKSCHELGPVDLPFLIEAVQLDRVGHLEKQYRPGGHPWLKHAPVHRVGHQAGLLDRESPGNLPPSVVDQFPQ